MAFLVAFWLYAKNKKNADAPTTVLKLLFGLRFVLFCCTAFFLLNIFLTQIKNQTQNPLVLVAIDNSSSMISGADSVYVKRQLSENIEAFKNAIEKKYEVKTLRFGENTGQAKVIDFTDKETDLDNLLKDVENNFSGQNASALVIISDGIYNKGANPLYTQEKQGIAIYPVACGDTTENQDATILKVNCNRVAYLGNDFPVEVALNAKKLKGKKMAVGLYQGNKLLVEQNLDIGSDNFTGTLTYTLNASQAGVASYNVVVKSIEGEKNTMNNKQQFVMEVIDNRDKILLLAKAPHPDVAAIKEILSEADNYELVSDFADSYSGSFKAYSLVIFHGLDNSQLTRLNECRTNAIPFWIVNPAITDNLPGVKISTALNRYNDSEPFYNESFSLFTISSALKNFIKDLPAVKASFGNYALASSSSSFINQRIGSVETAQPILFFSEINALKSAVFIGDGLWRWRLRDYAEHGNTNVFNELLSKTIQYLSVKSDKSFFRVNSQKIINENEDVLFDAEVYNKSYEAITNLDVNLVLSDKGGKKFNYAFSKTTNAYRLNAGQLTPGEYAYEASVKTENELQVKKGIFTVKEVVSEKINTVANHRLLYQMANRSGGKLYYPQQFKQLEQDLLNSETIKPVTYSEKSMQPLIEWRWLFGLLLLLASIEWILRKRYLQI